MAADVELGSPNPCCALWIQRSQKLEKSRYALRKSVKILEDQIERQKAEIDSLTKEIEKLQIQIEQGKDETKKETNIRMQLEKKVNDMKVKIPSFQNAMSFKSVDDDEIGILKARISGNEKEIKNLKDLLEKERRKTASEMRKTEQEKKNAAEALKLLKDEKKTVEEQKILMEVEKKKAEDLRLCLETFKIEANEAREMLKLEKAKALQAKTQVEVEKQNADAQKKRADLLNTKVKEQKRLGKEENKRNLDVEKLANHICQKLEERSKREELKKKMEDIHVMKESSLSYFGNRERNDCEVLAVSQFKLLKEKLKLERKRAKHAERVAKLEKSEKKIVMQEVHLLKHSLMQILCRLNMLDGLISDKEVIDGVPKIINSSDWKGLNLRNFLQSKKGVYNTETGFEPLESCPVEPLSYAGPRGECIGLPIPRGCCNRANTGIISDFEPPVSGPIRNKSQTSAVCSTSIDLSDRNLMGSQGRDSIVEISTDKLAEISKLGLTISKFSGEDVNTGMLKRCQDVLKHIDGCTNLVGADKATDKTVDPVVRHCSKKRKIQKSAESVARSENNMLYSKIGGIPSTLKDPGNCFDQLAAANRFEDIDDGNVQVEVQSGMCKSNYDNKVNVLCTDYKTKKLKNKHCNTKNAKTSGRKNSRSTCCIPEAVPDSSYPVSDQAAISHSNLQANSASFQNMIKGGCLKLLELDNVADEERYKKALEMPLSPNLPEIKTLGIRLDGEEDFHSLVDKDTSVPLCSFDVLDLDESSTNSISKIPTVKDLSIINFPSRDILHDATCGTFVANNGEPLVSECNDAKIFGGGGGAGRVSVVVQTVPDPQGHPVDFKLLRNSSSCGDVFDKAPEDFQTMDFDCIRNQEEAAEMNDPILSQSLNLTHTSEADRLTKNNSFLADGKAALHDVRKSIEPAQLTNSSPVWKLKCLTRDYCEADPGISLWFIASFSSAWNFESLSRILCAFNTLQKCMVSQIDDSLFPKVPSSLILEKDLQSEEKVAVLFSFLLDNISARMSVHCKDAKEDDSFLYLESLALDIGRAVSDEKNKYALEQMFPLDVFFSLMEIFLIQREVLVIGDVMQHLSSSEDLPQNKFHLHVGNKCVISNDVTINQFLAGCMILASVCIAADNIGYLLIMSYKILRTSEKDISWILSALHIFVKICGNKFFNADTNSFLLTTINSLVSLLERGIKSVSAAPKMVAAFSPCVQCPFATGALSMEELMGFLLDVLEDYSLCRSNCQIMETLSIPLNRTDSSSDLRSKNTSRNDYGIHCSASCAIFRHRKLDENLTDFSSNMALCHFIDIMSLVELVGHYMSWEWTSKETIPRLLKMLEACVSEDFSASLFVLAGELGRLGIISGGYQHYGITELRLNLFKLLDKLISRKSNLPTQFAAVGAVLHLLPMNIKDIVLHSQDVTRVSSDIKPLQIWFFHLSDEQQTAAMNLFYNVDSPKR